MAVQKSKSYKDVKNNTALPRTEKEKLETTWQRIIVAMDCQTVLDAEIQGLEQGADGTVRFITYIGAFKVLISNKDFYLDDTVSKISGSCSNEKELRSKERLLASKMMGASISIVIQVAQELKSPKTKEKLYIVTASRKVAMQKKKDKYYFSGEYPSVGDEIYTRVIRCTRKYAFVDALGMEVFVPTAELSSLWTNPVTDFPPGTILPMKVTEIAVDVKEKKVEMKLSRKIYDRAEALMKIKGCRIDSRWKGTIIGISEYNYFARIEGLNVLGVIKKSDYMGEPMTVSDNLFFQVKVVNEEKCCLVGYCYYAQNANLL